MSQILLEIQINDGPNIIERRFPFEMSITDLKLRLELVTGASASTMELTFQDTLGNFIGIGENSKQISDYLISNSGDCRLRLHVKDSNAIKLDDLSEVPMYEMSEDDYSKRTESVRAFKMRNKLGRFSKEHQEQPESGESEIVKNWKIGDRCEVTLKNMPPRRGQIMYIGKIGNLTGTFVGVKYDEPYGKNDGTYENFRYFECQKNYGSFVKPNLVKVGNYPVEDDVNFDEL